MHEQINKRSHYHLQYLDERIVTPAMSLHEAEALQCLEKLNGKQSHIRKSTVDVWGNLECYWCYVRGDATKWKLRPLRNR